MKNITKYILAAAAAFSSLTACQEFEDFDKTIDGTPGLVYVQTGTENLYTIRVVHKPTGSTGEFFTEFPVRCNTTRHAGVKATFVYDASLVESYNAEHKTSYAALPAEYLTLENTTLTVPENATASADSVKVTLTGNLSLLTERNYLAPLRIKAESIDASEVMGAVYVAVATEINLIRAIESTDDMVGFTATGRSAWTADCGNYANLFDGSTSTSVDFPEQYGNVLNIDMKEPQLVTGLCLGYGSVPSVSIEYSADGETFSQAGTPVAGEYVTGGSRMYAAFYGHIEARYLRLTIGFSSSWSKTLSEIDIYKIDSEDPTVYAVTGTENLITGKITHRQTGSTSDVNASFSAYATVASTSGYTVSVAADNSLVAAYNTAHDTSYAALPAEYLQLDNNPLTIAAGAYKSEGEVTVSLKGDLTRLSDLNGYLAPLKLSSSGAGTSAGRGVVYLAVKVERNKIRPHHVGRRHGRIPRRRPHGMDCRLPGLRQPVRRQHLDAYQLHQPERQRGDHRHEIDAYGDRHRPQQCRHLVRFVRIQHRRTDLPDGRHSRIERIRDVGFRPLHRLLRLPRSPLSAPDHQFLKQLEQIRQRIQHL